MAHKKDFNYRITEFFLNNTRLTILTLFLVVVFGVFSTLALKTVGFPNPEIKFTIVSTPYIGADSETVLREVTEPIEDSIDGIDGIDSYSSTSIDSFSSVVVAIESNADKTAVDADIQSAIDGLNLPEDAGDSEVFSPEIGGADIILSIYQPDLATRYSDIEELISFINDIDETEEVIESNEFTKDVVFTLNNTALEENNITQQDIERAITTSNETLPVVSNVVLDGEVRSIVTNVSNELTLDSIQDIQVFGGSSQDSPQGRPGNAPQGPGAAPEETSESFTLSQLGTFEIEYNFADDINKFQSIRGEDGDAQVIEVVNLEIKTKADTDQGVYFDEILEFLEDEDNFAYTADVLPDTDDTIVINNYTVAEENEVQVSEVLSGLLGGPLDIDNETLGQIGWLLGGIQLVFLVMLLFVSWRAAVIAALSIPLSLVFTNIYLFLIGENLNTLVLFSFVLVIGLVVDPALVILESIQRKIDTGLRGKEAALAAVRDVGLGLFLATLTNIIVFSPFGIVSGVLGQIFQYIPLTIIPAVVGSYIVPLVFLSWIGGAFMRRGKNTSENEQENLWGIARTLINFNRNLLESHWLIRTSIVVVLLVLSFGITGFMFGSGQVKQVQFASGDNPPFLVVQNEFKAGLTDEDQRTATKELLMKVNDIDGVEQAFIAPQFGGVFVNLEEDRSDTAREISEDINEKVEDLSSYFFDIKAGPLANGPADSLYQVQIAVKDNDLDKIKEASVEVGNTLETVCFVDGEYIVNDCEGEENIVAKVDDGFTDKVTKVLYYNFNREEIAENELLSPQGPGSIILNQTLRGFFPESNNGDPFTEVLVDESKQDLYIQESGENITELEELNNSTITSLSGQELTLSEVSEVEERDAQSAIRRTNGETINTVQLRLKEGFTDQGTAAQVTAAIVDYYAEDDYENTLELGLKEEAVGLFEEGGSADFLRSFQELLLALVLAIVFSYFVLAAFFNSLSQPFTILYTIPLTFIGIFPAIAFLSNGQFGLLEIIGLIILVGLVENVAIFLMDSANQSIAEGKHPKEAIAVASGIRLRPVILTNLTAIASLAPLAFLSETYRPLSLVIIFGLSTSGIVSLVTTPILFIFFRWLSHKFRMLPWYGKIFFILFNVLVILYWAIFDQDTDEDPHNIHDDTDEDSDTFFDKHPSIDIAKMNKKKKK